MCGIAGIIKFTPQPDSPRADTASLAAMSAAIAHRGPDGSGEFIDPRPNTFAALLHRRLAILDRPGGTQPMPNEDGTVHVIFNGEIYNHAQLRQQLIAAGHTFRSHHSDTEVLVHGWEQWGESLPQRLTGMFAFAIYDTRPITPGGSRQLENATPQDHSSFVIRHSSFPATLVLARDRLGQKPLFYASLDDGIVFGSTIPAILAWPEVPRRMPRELLALYLQLGYFPPPFTPFRDIAQVMPGHWLRLRGEVLDGERYWSPTENLTPNPTPTLNPSHPPSTQSELSTLKSQISNPQQQLRSHLTHAVESQLIADTPIACFLSGGIDSSIIALLMQNAARTAGAPPIHTVSVGFSESNFDETAHAAAVARHIGSRHTRLEVSASQNILETLRTLMRTSLGQPFADSSILPTYHLSRAVRDLAPVALAGDGGDELFAGYDRYRAMQLLSRWSTVARLLPKSAPLGNLKRRERYRRLTAAAREQSPQDRYTRLTEIMPPDLVAQLCGIEPEDPITNDQLPITTLPHPTPNTHHPSPFRPALLHDQLHYLPGDLLCKVDAAAMAHALEVRAPFLDHSLVEFANQLPDDQLLHKGTSKFILRQTFAQDLPPAILTRPKKGFAVPIGTWFRTTLRAPLQDLLLSPTSFTRQHLNPKAIETLLTEHQSQSRDHTHRLFALLMLELWAQEFHPTLE